MEFKFTALDAVAVATDARTVTGYASVFGNVDSYGDLIVRGAYAATIKAAKGKGLPMLWQHGSDNLIGRWTALAEDDTGLFVEGRLTPGHSKAEDVYASLKNGDVDGLSIGFRVPPGGAAERGDGVRVLKRIDLMEVSIVVMPADAQARVGAVKATDLRHREFRALLQGAMREAGCDMSRREAEALMVGGFKGLIATRDAGGRQEPEALSRLLEAIRTARG